MTRRVQLYGHCRRGFRLANYLVDEGIVLKDASSMPAMYWPDGRWCFEVNQFLSSLWEAGLKHQPKGGTLGTYSAQLTPLIHFVYKRRGCDFSRLTNSDFVSCMSALSEDTALTSIGSVRKRNDTTVRAMGQLWLEFLDFLARSYSWTGFIGEYGAIRAKKLVIKEATPVCSEVSTWTHISIPNRGPVHRRFPMTQRATDLLRAAASRTKVSFQRRRRLAMLELFDVVGFRRIEASLLRVADVESAISSMRENPGLRTYNPEPDDHSSLAHVISFRMRKQSDGNENRLRTAPISATSLAYLGEYLELRGRYLKRKGLREDVTQGMFFFNLETGHPLTPNTFTLEIHYIASEYNASVDKSMRIPLPCSPHMLRARYITREFVRLIMSHELENPDDFRRALIDIDRLKKEVSLLIGHRDVKSLDFYIDLAFAEVGNLARTKARVEGQRDVDAVVAAAHRYKLAVANGEDPRRAGDALANQVSALSSNPLFSPDGQKK